MSGSRGPPQSGNRYSDYNDYEYGSSKPPRSKKPQFQQGGRRDFTKPLPGSSSLTHSMGGDEYSGGGRRYGSGSGGSSRGGAYGSYGGSGAGGSGGTGGGGGGYNKPWRSSSQGDLKGGNSGNNSSYSPRISSSNGGQ